MAAYTTVYMSPTIPHTGSMPSIGCAAATWGRTDSHEERESYNAFSNTDAWAEFIRHDFGESAFDEYIAKQRARKEEEQREKERKAARRQARKAANQRRREKVVEKVKKIGRRMGIC
ncbi:hypothetical protein MMC06_002502 [Schaereria dolodes]|nr:hypothetical protein [Schaereria dolodes]